MNWYPDPLSLLPAPSCQWDQLTEGRSDNEILDRLRDGREPFLRQWIHSNYRQLFVPERILYELRLA